MKTIIEPFRIKAVEPIRMTTPEERAGYIERARYNLFLLDAEDVLIDLLTDSGTSSMSTAQWAGIMRGDESYAGSPSYARFEAAVRHLMPFRHVIPTHQGRAAERILFSVAVQPGQFVPNNGHFDTTRANIEAQQATAVDLTCEEGLLPELEHPFKGNMDVARLEAFIAEKGPGSVPLCMLTITNNAVGGQPVSMENIRQTREVCRRHGVPLLFDACRFAENAYFIKLREPGYADTPITDIVRQMFSYADGCTMSAKKDAFANIGGWLSLDDDAWAAECRNVLIVTEGFPDLRWHGRARSRSHCGRARGDRRGRVPQVPRGLRALRRTRARRGGRADDPPRGCARDLPRREGLPAAHPAARVPGPVARGGDLRARRHQEL